MKGSERAVVARHEAGHAVVGTAVAKLLPGQPRVEVIFGIFLLNALCFISSCCLSINWRKSNCELRDRNNIKLTLNVLYPGLVWVSNSYEIIINVTSLPVFCSIRTNFCLLMILCTCVIRN